MREALHGDVNPRRFSDSLPSPTVRVATVRDIPFILEVAQEAYPDRDVVMGIPYMCWCLNSPDRLVLVGQNCFGLARFAWEYGLEARARSEMLASRKGNRAPWEVLQIVRQMLIWAKQRGAKGDFVLDSDTEVDFEPFARRLKGRKTTLVQYKIALETCHG